MERPGAVITSEREALSMRRLPIGAEVLADGAVHFRVWAPKPRRIELLLAPHPGHSKELLRLPMESEGGGYFSLRSEQAKVGMRYGFRLDGERIRPDPASRFQPEGPGGLSQIVDPNSFQWSDGSWRGGGAKGQVLYELHVPTFSPEGTFAGAARELAELKRVGITTLEVMPVADYPGRFGWGYDGVNMFAPTRLYGQPDDFRRFVDQAHAVGLGVILDVVYNHFGNVDNYLGEFSDYYHTAKYKNEWAAAINYDGDHCAPVREFFVANARYWIEEFHLDGFRFDATQSIFDSSSEHILAEVCGAARKAAGQREIYLIAENEPEDVRHVMPIEQGGYGFDAIWDDDFHHSAQVMLTKTNPAYYSDFLGTPEELAAAVKGGLIYQGQRSQWQDKPRGTPTTGLPATAFVTFLQNHDQISNSPTGARIHQLTSPGLFRAMTTLWLLSPQTPLLFQGQEFGANSPFLYFADFSGDMADKVRRGRWEFLSQFPSLASKDAQRQLPNPIDPAVFQRCKLDFAERQSNQHIYELHADLLKLRREDVVFRAQDADKLDTALLGPACLAVRYFGGEGDDRLVVANFGSDLDLQVIAQPLLAPPQDKQWKLLFSSNDQRYHGPGVVPATIDSGSVIPGEATIVLKAVAVEGGANGDRQ